MGLAPCRGLRFVGILGVIGGPLIDCMGVAGL